MCTHTHTHTHTHMHTHTDTHTYTHVYTHTYTHTHTHKHTHSECFIKEYWSNSMLTLCCLNIPAYYAYHYAGIHDGLEMGYKDVDKYREIRI